MTEPEEQQEGQPIPVSLPDPIHLQAPDGTNYVIADEGALASALGVEYVAAYRATEKGLEWLTENRRWENVEAGQAKVAAIKRN